MFFKNFRPPKQSHVQHDWNKFQPMNKEYNDKGLKSPAKSHHARRTGGGTSVI